MFRVHQFDKIEMFVFTRPEWSREEHDRLLGIEEELVQELGLPYRVVGRRLARELVGSDIDIENPAVFMEYVRGLGRRNVCSILQGLDNATHIGAQVRRKEGPDDG